MILVGGSGLVGACASLGVSVPGAVRFVGQNPGFNLELGILGPVRSYHNHGYTVPILPLSSLSSCLRRIGYR